MDRINSFFNFLFSPFYNYLHLLLRLTLGISFFLHGYGKLDRISGFSGYLESKGIIFSKYKTKISFIKNEEWIKNNDINLTYKKFTSEFTNSKLNWKPKIDLYEGLNLMINNFDKRGD